MKLIDLITELSNGEYHDVVQVLNESGEVYDVLSVEYDPEAKTTYVKIELAE